MKPLLLSLFLFVSLTLNATENPNLINSTNLNGDYGKKKVELGVSESDAEIFINGKLVGKGSAEVTVPKNDCVTVIIKKVAYLTERIEFCNKKN